MADFRIFILSRDLLFAHMLAIELSGEGREVEYGDVPPEDIAKNSGSADDGVRNFLLIAQDLPVPSGCSAVTISRGGGSDFRRPFPMSEFREYISRKLSAMKSAPSASPPPPSSASDRGGRMPQLTAKLGCAVYRGEKVPLTQREYKLLTCLLSHRGEVMTREALRRAVWDSEDGTTNLVDVYVRYLRGKLDDHFGCRLIFTVRGTGYMIK